MHKVTRAGVTLHVDIQGPDDGVPVVFANSLGTNLRMWDPILPLLPARLRLIRYDKRGHGQSDVPDGPYTMGQLVSDAAAVCDAAKVRDALFVGLSVGGMIAQGLAVKRPDLIRAVVLSNTAAKIGNPAMWQDRIDQINTDGLPAMADQIMQRWFSRDFYGTDAVAPWQAMLSATPKPGYLGVSSAISGTDFYTSTSSLRIPALGIAGAEDGSTPPDLVRETTDLIPGSQFALIRRAGHLPCVEKPHEYADILTQFMQDIGHLDAA